METINDSKEIYVRVFFASVIDLVIAVIFLVIFSYVFDTVYRSIYYHFEYEKLFLPETSDVAGFHWVTSAWNRYGNLLSIVVYLTALISLNRAVSGNWFSSSAGKKIFGLIVVSQRESYFISGFLMVLRYFLSIPLLCICVLWRNIFDALEVWQISLVVLSVYFSDFIVIMLSKNRKIRDYICGSSIQSISQS